MEINEQNLKNILVEQREEYQRHLGVLEENHQRHLGVIAESFESQVKLVAETTIGIQQQLVTIRDLVAKNTEDIEEMKMDLHIIRQDLKEKVGRDEFVLLEQRITKLEKAAHHK